MHKRYFSTNLYGQRRRFRRTRFSRVKVRTPFGFRDLYGASYRTAGEARTQNELINKEFYC